MSTSNPIILEDLPCLSINEIRRWFMKKSIPPKEAIIKIKEKKITDGLNYVIGEFKIMKAGEPNQPQINLVYECNDEEVNDSINLSPVTSNLGCGLIYYFICPVTEKKCKKLYLYQNHFVGRMAIPGVHYRLQTESKSKRQALFVDRKVIKCWQMVLSQQKPYFKPTYAGHYTKNRQKVQRACILLKQYQNMSIN